MAVEFISRHKAGSLLVFYLGLAVLLLTFRVDPYVRGIKAALWFLIAPDVVYTGQFFNKLDALRGRTFRLIRVEGENHILRRQNATLAIRDVEREALEAENNRLRGLLSLAEKTFPEAIAAEVISRDVRDWFHSVIINKGGRDGIQDAAAVVAHVDGRPVLVGRVFDVHETTSRVLLITDAVSSVSVALAPGDVLGLLQGRNRDWAVVSYLPLDVRSGDLRTVQSAGLGGVFPAGIPIGAVTAVAESKDGLFTEARVELAAPLSALLEVLVVQRMDRPSSVRGRP